MLAIEEKPAEPQVQLCGDRPLLLRRPRQRAIAKTLKPSARGELEITALNHVYLRRRAICTSSCSGRGFAWLDTGTHDSLIQAGELVRTFEQRQGLRIGCLEEIAFHQGWIDKAELMDLAARSGPYGAYLRAIAEVAP